jgi:hypothetical protein
MATSRTGVGSATITGSAGDLRASNYDFTTVDGTLTINKATLIYTANALARFTGEAITGFSGKVTGFAADDTQTNATTGAMAWDSPATLISPVGKYAIIGAGLRAANYTFVQAESNQSALSLTSSPILNPVVQIASDTLFNQPSGSGVSERNLSNRMQEPLQVASTVSGNGMPSVSDGASPSGSDSSTAVGVGNLASPGNAGAASSDSSKGSAAGVSNVTTWPNSGALSRIQIRVEGFGLRLPEPNP